MSQTNVGFVSARLYAEILESGAGSSQYDENELADCCATIAVALVGEDSTPEIADRVIEQYGERGFFYKLAFSLAPLFDANREDSNLFDGGLYNAPASVIHEHATEAFN